MAIAGLAVAPEILEEVSALLRADLVEPSAVVKEQRDALNSLAERAKTAAGAGERARHGTILHKYTEELDAGQRTLDKVPDLYRADAEAYVQALARYGYTPLPHLIERTTTVVDLAVMGTLDRVLRRDCDGTYVIGDVKSGSNALTYAEREIAAQLAGYEIGVNGVGVAEYSGEGNHLDWTAWRWAPLVDEHGNPIRVRTDFAVVMHVPFGSGECELYEVDLEQGRRELEACRLVRDRHKAKGMLRLLDLPVTDGHSGSEAEPPAPAEPDSGDMLAEVLREQAACAVPSWEDRFTAVTSREEASALFREARGELDADRLKALVSLGREALGIQAA
jgi:hypothetical protein